MFPQPRYLLASQGERSFLPVFLPAAAHASGVLFLGLVLVLHRSTTRGQAPPTLDLQPLIRNPNPPTPEPKP